MVTGAAVSRVSLTAEIFPVPLSDSVELSVREDKVTPSEALLLVMMTCNSGTLIAPGMTVVDTGGLTPPTTMETAGGVGVMVGVEVGVLVVVGVVVRVTVGVKVGVAVGVKVGVKDKVTVGVKVGVAVGVKVTVGVKVGVTVGVGVKVMVGVNVGVKVVVKVRVGVSVTVGVGVAVRVTVGVSVEVGVKARMLKVLPLINPPVNASGAVVVASNAWISGAFREFEKKSPPVEFKSKTKIKAWDVPPVNWIKPAAVKVTVPLEASKFPFPWTNVSVPSKSPFAAGSLSWYSRTLLETVSEEGFQLPSEWKTNWLIETGSAPAVNMN
jgi:hypothetical protein